MNMNTNTNTNTNTQSIYDDRNRFSQIRPTSPAEFWNYPRDGSIKRIIKLLKSGNPPGLSIYYGDYGTAKTSMARYHGMWSACQEPGDDNLPCGRCRNCQAVVSSSEYWRANFFEIDCGRPELWKSCWREAVSYRDFEIFTMMNERKIRDRKATILLDEAQRISEKGQDWLLKTLEDLNDVSVILATTKLEFIDEGLQSRAGINKFAFTRPTPEEVADHMIRIVNGLGGSLEASVAEKIATDCEGSPRECLTMLETLYRCNKSIDEGVYRYLYGE